MESLSLSTPVPLQPAPFGLSHRDDILMLGSCFADGMAQRLRDAAFVVESNPFGVLYNPISLAQCLTRCAEGEEIGEENLTLQGGLWHSWLHHGSFSAPSKEACLGACNLALGRAHQFLARCNTLVVTFGTAFAYQLAEDGRVVGNCHKAPQRFFTKRLLGANEIADAWRRALSLASGLCRHPLRVILTVSPIRHWRDGAHGNALSKATLLLAAHQLEQIPCKDGTAAVTASYFPSFEIMMDELRDYRFYADDMLHPSSLAQRIIWERLKGTYMSEDTLALTRLAERVATMRAHRPLFPGSEAYNEHLRRTDLLEEELRTALAHARQ